MEIFRSRGPWLRRVILASLLAAILVGSVFVAGAATSYDLSVSNSIDGPEQELTVEGETYRVSSLSYFERGDPIDVTVSPSGDDGSEYRLLLYDSDRRIEKTTRTQVGDRSVTFGTDELSPGTYFLAVDDGGFQAVHPVVVQGYDVSVDTRSTVATGETWTATATLDSLDDAPSVHTVEFVLLGEDTEKRFQATETDSGTYEADVTAPDGAGEYSFGVIVRGTNEVEGGEYEPIAVSQPVSLAVQDGGSGGDGEQGGDGGEESRSTATPTDGTATATPEASATPTATDARTDEEPTSTETTRTETDGTDEPEGPVTPVDPTETTESEDPISEEAGIDDQPGFGAGAAVAALLATLALLARRP